MRASEYTIFKTKAAARLKLNPPESEFQLGCVMLNIASAVGEKQYDWQNKITVKFGVNDVTNIIFGIRSHQEVSLFHQFGETSKRVVFKPGDKGWFLTVNDKSIPISYPEILAINIMLEHALPLMHNWK